MKPKHIGIILDGNRRFSKRLMKEPWKGHEYGAKKLESLFTWLKELDIKKLTLYVFSVENFNRPKLEFNHLMNLFRKEFTKYKDDPRIHDNKIRINFVGQLHLFPEDVQKKAKALMNATKDYDDHVVNFAFGYGGREEILDAVKEAVKRGVDPSKLTKEEFNRYLSISDEFDLVIRTGGDHRSSNFFPWQTTYAEWFFLDKMWPEFEKEDLVKVINQFENCDRRFGK